MLPTFIKRNQDKKLLEIAQIFLIDLLSIGLGIQVCMLAKMSPDSKEL